MPNRLALAGAVFIAIAELLGPQRASAPEAQSGRRYKKSSRTLLSRAARPSFSHPEKIRVAPRMWCA